MKLEQHMYDAFNKYDLAEPCRQKIIHLLNAVKNVDVPTYEHSIRVGLLSPSIGEFSEMDSKPLLYGGLLHDVGKSEVDPAILRKGDTFTEEDMRIVRTHVLKGYFILKDTFPFTAELEVRHHSYQKDSYPIIPEPKIEFSRKSHLQICLYSRIIALADFYDALLTRQNKKFSEGVALNSSKLIDILIEHNPDSEFMIQSLAVNDMFRDFYTELGIKHD